MQQKPKRRIQRQEGDILEIVLPDNSVSYGRVLNSPLIGFYRSRYPTPVMPEMAARDVFGFKIWVHNSAVREGRWKVVGHLPLSLEDQTPPWFIHQDALSGDVSLYRHGGGHRAASVRDIENNEADAIWDPEQVEQRLLDFFEKRPNKFVLSMRNRALNAFLNKT